MALFHNSGSIPTKNCSVDWKKKKKKKRRKKICQYMCCPIHFQYTQSNNGTVLLCTVKEIATRTQNFEREVFFYYFTKFPLFLSVKLSRLWVRKFWTCNFSLLVAVFPQVKSLSIDFLRFLCRAIRAKTIRTLLENLFS